MTKKDAAAHNIRWGALLGYAALGLNVAANLLVAPFAVGCLGQGEYGVYKLMASVVSTMSVLDFGLGQTVTRYVAQYRLENDKTAEHRLLAFVMALYCLIALILCVVAVPLRASLGFLFQASLTPGEIDVARSLFAVIAFNFAVSIVGGVYSAIMQGYERFAFLKGVQLLRIVLRVVLIYALLRRHNSAMTLALIDTGLNVAIIVINLFYCKRNLQVLPVLDTAAVRALPRDYMREIVSFSLALFTGLVVEQLLTNANTLIIGMRINSAAVTVYSIGLNFSMVFSQVAIVLSNVLLPQAVRLCARGDNGPVNDFMRMVSRYQSALMLLVYTGFLLLGRQFIDRWMGPGYEEAWLSAAIVMTGYLPGLIENAGYAILRARNRHWMYTRTFLIILSLNVVLAFFAVKRFGILGAAVTTMVSLLLGILGILNPYYQKEMGLDIKGLYKELCKRVFPGAALLFAAAYLLVRNLALTSYLRIALAGIVYAGCYLLMAWFLFLRKEERAAFTNRLRKKQ